jgi:hypothetical protein
VNESAVTTAATTNVLFIMGLPFVLHAEVIDDKALVAGAAAAVDAEIHEFGRTVHHLLQERASGRTAGRGLGYGRAGEADTEESNAFKTQSVWLGHTDRTICPGALAGLQARRSRSIGSREIDICPTVGKIHKRGVHRAELAGHRIALCIRRRSGRERQTQCDGQDERKSL